MDFGCGDDSSGNSTSTASPSSSLTSTSVPSSSSSGYICYGNWKELCSLGEVELPENNQAAERRDSFSADDNSGTDAHLNERGSAREKDVRRPQVRRVIIEDSALSDLTVEATSSSAWPANSSTPSTTASSALVTTLLPTLGLSFPLPVPSQTDCSSDYVW